MADNSYIFTQNQRLIVDEQGDWCHQRLVYSSLADENLLNVNLGGHKRYRVAEVDQVIDEQRLLSFRQLMGQVSSEDAALISRALQLINWKKQHQYCGRCGRGTCQHPDEQALVCENCCLTFYPRIAPCIMCLVTRGDECLLAHHQRHREGIYSTLAGFVEAGENLEQTLHREVLEEVGIKVKQLTYFSSQSWPFPHQLMVGYFAEYDSGDIRLDEEEIQDARWFHYAALPRTSSLSSLSGKLIAEFVRRRKRLENT